MNKPKDDKKLEEPKNENVEVQQEGPKPEDKKKTTKPENKPEPPTPPKKLEDEHKSFLAEGGGDVEKLTKDYADLAYSISKGLSEDLNASLGKKIKNKWKEFKENKDVQEELGKVPSELKKMPGKLKDIIKDHYNSLGKNSLSKPPDSAKIGKEPEAVELQSLPDIRQQRQQTPTPTPEPKPEEKKDGPKLNT